MRLKSILVLSLSIICASVNAQSAQRLKAQLGTCSGILISPQCIANSNFINATEDGATEYNSKNVVKSFDLIIVKTGMVYRTHIVGNKIDPYTHTLLEHLKGNDGIYISNVNCSSNESKKNCICAPALQIVENYKDQDSITVYLHSVSNTTSSVMVIKDQKQKYLDVKGNMTELLYTVGHQTGTALQRFYSNEILKYEKVYYASGNLSMSLYFLPNHKIASEEYYMNGKIHRSGMFLDMPALLKWDEFSSRDSFSRLNGNPIGYWKWNYPDGRPKMEGKFDTATFFLAEMLDVNEKSSEKNKPAEEQITIFKEGIWKYYDEEGKVTQVTYSNGDIIKKE
jgi:antitoxin component YwqK of YwqJK toxin-antitoxin module